jgi:hypothetical protein
MPNGWTKNAVSQGAKTSPNNGPKLCVHNLSYRKYQKCLILTVTIEQVQSNEDTARPKPSPKRVYGRRTADILVPSSQSRPREPATEDVEYIRSEAREQRPHPSLQDPSTSNSRRKIRDYNTPPPSRSRSIEDGAANNIGVAAPCISNPRHRGHPSPTIGEIAEEQLDDDEEMFRQEVIFGPPSGGDMSRPLADEENGSQEGRGCIRPVFDMVSFISPLDEVEEEEEEEEEGALEAHSSSRDATQVSYFRFINVAL